jgi:hypothetical protein
MKDGPLPIECGNLLPLHDSREEELQQGSVSISKLSMGGTEAPPII